MIECADCQDPICDGESYIIASASPDERICQECASRLVTEIALSEGTDRMCDDCGRAMSESAFCYIIKSDNTVLCENCAEELWAGEEGAP